MIRSNMLVNEYNLNDKNIRCTYIDLFVDLQFRDGGIRFYPSMTTGYEDIALNSK